MRSTEEEIIKKIKRLQNGDVSRAMKRMGIIYNLNYGVSIPQLRQLANEYAYNNELANNLLVIDIRETKILASMLFNPADFTLEQLQKISLQVDNLELVEQFSQNCFAPKSELLSLIAMLEKGNYWQKLLALYCVSWHIKKSNLPDEQAIEWGVGKIKSLISTEDLLIQKALVFLIQSIASYTDEYRKKMLEMADELLNTDNKFAQQMAQDFLWLNMA